MSFILDALRKSEHERQRSTVPGLAQVPSATADPQVPRWVVPVIGALAVAVLVLGAAWWQSTRGANDVPAPAASTTRTVELPTPTPQPVAAAASPAAPPRVPLAETTRTPATSASSHTTLEAVAGGEPAAVTREAAPPAVDAAILPSAAALASEGVPLPALRLDLHAYSEQRGNRFVFINGRKYAEGERLPDGLVLEAIEPRGAVLRYNGRRFLLVPE